MNKKLNIAIFTDNFLPGVGGTENATVNIATELVNKGHNVLVVAPKYKTDCPNNLPFKVVRKASIKIDANDYYALPFFNHNIFKKVDNFKPDLVHCQTQASMLSLALKYAKKRKIPCISTIHTKFSFAYHDAVKCKFLVNIALKKIGKKLKKADLVTAVSYSMGQEFKLYGYNGKFDVIKNGACFSPVPDVEQNKLLAKKQFNFLNSDNILLFVGRLTKVKNISFIFDALDNLFITNKNFKFVIVGTGEDAKYFKNLANTKPYKNNVLFLGQITDKALLSSIYANAKLFLFPSIFDTDGLTVVESALNKVPSIVLENTGASERITNNQNGFTIANNPQEMAKKIDFLLKNPAILQKVGQNASLQLPHTWSEMVDKYLDLYYQVLDKKTK